MLALCAVLGGCVGPAEVAPEQREVAPERRPAAASGMVSGTPARFPASDVLREWDRARSRAYADGDVGALRGLYAVGSEAGRSDVRLLRAYLRRGLVVTGMQVQLLAVEVLHESPTRLRLRVTDRLTGAAAVDRDGTAIRLPRDAVSTRVVELVRDGGRGPWRVARVRG